MYPLQFAVLISQDSRHTGEAWSALPDAPQVADAAKAAPMRAVTAKALFRLADRLAPAPSPTC